jgi:hypothetical protein
VHDSSSGDEEMDRSAGDQESEGESG